MTRDRNRLDRVVSGPEGVVRVVCRPAGNAVRDLADRTSFDRGSGLPGLLGVVGLLVHLTVFRGRWVVDVRPADPEIDGLRVSGLRRREAESVLESVLRRIADGERLAALRTSILG